MVALLEYSHPKRRKTNIAKHLNTEKQSKSLSCHIHVFAYFTNTIGNPARSSQPFLSFGRVDMVDIASFAPLYINLAILRRFQGTLRVFGYVG